MAVIVSFAVEDDLSESVVRRCFKAVGVEAGMPLGRRGFGYLKSIARELNQSAKGMPYLMLTDLDTAECPPTLIADWLAGVARHPDFLIRVAVREVEAWLLADSANLAVFLGISQAILPRDVETLSDPKLELLRAARRSRFRRIREDVVFAGEHGPVQGPDYNGALSRFVETAWDLDQAGRRCPSLRRMLERIEALRRRRG